MFEHLTCASHCLFLIPAKWLTFPGAVLWVFSRDPPRHRWLSLVPYSTWWVAASWRVLLAATLQLQSLLFCLSLKASQLIRWSFSHFLLIQTHFLLLLTTCIFFFFILSCHLLSVAFLINFLRYAHILHFRLSCIMKHLILRGTLW